MWVCNVHYSVFNLYAISFLAEYMKRLAIFQHNLVRARKMQDMDQGSAKYGVTVFSDLTGKLLCDKPLLTSYPFILKLCFCKDLCNHCSLSIMHRMTTLLSSDIVFVLVRVAEGLSCYYNLKVGIHFA